MKRSFIILICICFVCSATSQTKSLKRGVSFNFTNELDLEALTHGTSWFYNWANTPGKATDIYSKYGYEFCPMAWNGAYNADAIRNYVLGHPECKYILAYNEPNFKDQANMTPQQAAANWPGLKALADELGLKIISPALNYSPDPPYYNPFDWLDEFFELIPISDVDGIACHCYMNTAGAMAGYVNEYIARYNKPVWLTEFCAWDGFAGDANAQRRYMIEAIDFLETEPMVERYAWFIPRTNEGLISPYMQLLTMEQGELTDNGLVWNYMSSYDEDYYHCTEIHIEAEYYIRMKGIYLEPTTDVDGNIQINDYNTADYIDYNIDVAEAGNYYLFFRYTAGSASELDIEQDGEKIASITLPYSGGQQVWATKKFRMTLSEGKQRIRLNLRSGNVRLNWLAISEDADFVEETEDVPEDKWVNLALNKSTSASSEQAYGNRLAKWAVDGKIDENRWATEWEGSNIDYENWFIVDLESDNAYIDKIIIHWETAYATGYEISVSDNKTDWKTVYTTTAGKGGVEEIPITDNGRYVKWHGTKKATAWGYSFYEFEVWGSTSTGIKNVDACNTFTVYPNPVKDILYIRSVGLPSSIMLSDMNGRKLMEAFYVNSIDISSLEAGIYILSVQDSSGRKSSLKIIKK